MPQNSPYGDQSAVLQAIMQQQQAAQPMPQQGMPQQGMNPNAPGFPEQFVNVMRQMMAPRPQMPPTGPMPKGTM